MAGLLDGVKQGQQDANGSERTQAVASFPADAYQPFASFRVYSGPEAAQYEAGFLRGWDSIAHSLAPHKGDRTLVSQYLQTLVVDWTEHPPFAPFLTNLYPELAGWNAGHLAACDAAFGVSR